MKASQNIMKMILQVIFYSYPEQLQMFLGLRWNSLISYDMKALVVYGDSISGDSSQIFNFR